MIGRVAEFKQARFRVEAGAQDSAWAKVKSDACHAFRLLGSRQIGTQTRVDVPFF